RRARRQEFQDAERLLGRQVRARRLVSLDRVHRFSHNPRIMFCMQNSCIILNILRQEKSRLKLGCRGGRVRDGAGRAAGSATMSTSLHVAASALALLALAPQDPPAPAGPDFVRDVRPILDARCVSCHGPKKSKGKLRLDARALALRGGASGPAIVPGKGSTSKLVELVVSSDPDDRMPKDAPPLPAAEIAVLRASVDARRT